MKFTTTWKNLLLLLVGSAFAFHVQVVSAQDDSTEINTSTTDEECVITDDQV